MVDKTFLQCYDPNTGYHKSGFSTEYFSIQYSNGKSIWIPDKVLRFMVRLGCAFLVQNLSDLELNHKPNSRNFCVVFRSSLEYWTFLNQTCFDHLNTGPVRYLDCDYTSSKGSSFLHTTVGIWIPKKFSIQIVKKEAGCQLVQFSNAIWIQDSRTIWIPDKWTPPCFLFYWSDIQMVGLVQNSLPIDRPFQYQTIWNPNSKKSGIQMFLIFRSPLS